MKIRVSRALDKFAKRASETLGIEPWAGIDDPDKELLFFGLYNERDFEVFDNFKGKKYVFWGGSDILRAVSDYERRRILKNNPAEHYCENEIEAIDLVKCGLEPKIVPTFLDDIEKYEITYKHSKNPELFMCVNTGREEEYGVNFVKGIAKKVPFAKFHIYGIENDAIFFKTSAKTKEENGLKIDLDTPNVIYHGKIPEAQFNEEIKNYQSGLRPNLRDGNSEVAMKSMFNGQYPITHIKYDDIWNYRTEEELISLIHKLSNTREPNTKGRDAWKNKINKFPFLCKK